VAVNEDEGRPFDTLETNFPPESLGQGVNDSGFPLPFPQKIQSDYDWKTPPNLSQKYPPCISGIRGNRSNYFHRREAFEIHFNLQAEVALLSYLLFEEEKVRVLSPQLPKESKEVSKHGKIGKTLINKGLREKTAFIFGL
jgi:hypothetical protein